MAAAPKIHWRWPDKAEFSYGLRCGKWSLCLAQMASAPSGETLFQGDIVGQARTTIDYVSKVLASLGCDLDDVVKLNTWYTGDGTDADWRKAAESAPTPFVSRGRARPAFRSRSLSQWLAVEAGVHGPPVGVR